MDYEIKDVEMEDEFKICHIVWIQRWFSLYV